MSKFYKLAVNRLKQIKAMHRYGILVDPESPDASAINSRKDSKRLLRQSRADERLLARGKDYKNPWFRTRLDSASRDEVNKLSKSFVGKKLNVSGEKAILAASDPINVFKANMGLKNKHPIEVSWTPEGRKATNLMTGTAGGAPLKLTSNQIQPGHLHPRTFDAFPKVGRSPEKLDKMQSRLAKQEQSAMRQINWVADKAQSLSKKHPTNKILAKVGPVVEFIRSAAKSSLESGTSPSKLIGMEASRFRNAPTKNIAHASPSGTDVRAFSSPRVSSSRRNMLEMSNAPARQFYEVHAPETGLSTVTKQTTGKGGLPQINTKAFGPENPNYQPRTIRNPYKAITPAAEKSSIKSMAAKALKRFITKR